MNGAGALHVLIIGAGPAGLAAALAAAQGGARVAVVDDNPAPGGQIWRAGPGARLPPLAQRMRRHVAAHPAITVLAGARVLAPGPGRTLLLEDAERGWAQPYDRLIVCTGARELLLPFAGWTLPGVTGAGGLQALIKAGLDVRGQRIVVAGSGPLLLAAAATAQQAGAQVLRVAEQAPWRAVARFGLGLVRWPGKLAQAVSLASAHYRPASHVLRAEGTGRVERVRLRQSGRDIELDCDRLACGFGLIPNTQLAQVLGCALTEGAHGGIATDAWQATSVPGCWAAGECTGFGGSERALAQGAIAGHAAVDNLQAARAGWPERARWQRFAEALARHFVLGAAVQQLAQPDTLVCRCEDVTYADMAACSEWIDAKLHTRCGMGACQGRVCAAAAAQLLGWQPPPARHLVAPARLGTLAAAPERTPAKDREQTLRICA